MDQPEDHNLMILQFYNKCHFLKRIVVFIITVSLFSLFLCFSSGFSILPNSFYVYFNTCLFSFLTRTLERKYMFLICNGILAFLAKSSVSSTSSTSEFYELLATKPIVVADDTVFKEEVALVAKVDEEKEKYEEGDKEVEKGESEDMVAPDEGQGQKRGVLEKLDQEEDDEREGDGNIDELTNTEELNRRIEEFIRKMKEEIRIEAQQQLIAV